MKLINLKSNMIRKTKRETKEKNREKRHNMSGGVVVHVCNPSSVIPTLNTLALEASLDCGSLPSQNNNDTTKEVITLWHCK